MKEISEYLEAMKKDGKIGAVIVLNSDGSFSYASNFINADMLRPLIQAVLKFMGEK